MGTDAEQPAPYSDAWLEQNAQTEDERVRLLQNVADANRAVADAPGGDPDAAATYRHQADANQEFADQHRFQSAMYRAAESDPNAPAPDPVDPRPVWEIEADGSGATTGSADGGTDAASAAGDGDSGSDAGGDSSDGGDPYS